MVLDENKGFDPEVIRDYDLKMKAQGLDYVLDEEDENTERVCTLLFFRKV